MQVKDIVSTIEDFAPAIYQESYDNCGLQLGDMLQPVTGVLCTLDVTEKVLTEAQQRGCNMIVAHHPLIFSGIKKITGRNMVERIIWQAIKNDISIFVAHTNLDNISNGVNRKIAEKLGLKDVKILSPKTGVLSKLYTYVPIADKDKVLQALFKAGAGAIGNYDECSFNTNGTGTFRPGVETNPTIGQAGGKRESVEEVKVEVLVERALEFQVLKALRENHPYEEIAYELIPISNAHQEIGSGMIGNLPIPAHEDYFLEMVKEKMNTRCIRHTEKINRPVARVAVCGGSGSFLLKEAMQAGADVFITADFKYHQFFEAEGKIIIADIGHFESEQFTPEIFEMILKKKFPNFAVLLSNTFTNPIKYLF